MGSRRLFTKLARKHGDEASEEKKQTEKVQTDVLRSFISSINADDSRDPSLLFSSFSSSIGNPTEHYTTAPEVANLAERPWVVVVGAGFAGLCCAYELLASKQFNVVVLEAGNRIGGRVWTVNQTDFDDHTTTWDHEFRTVERGGELVGLNHFFWLTYADKFDLHLDHLVPPTASEEEESSDDEASKELFEYMNLIIQEIDQEAAKLGLYDEQGNDIAPKPWEVPRARELDNTSLGQYLDGLLAKYKGLTIDELKKKGFGLNSFDVEKFKFTLDCTKSDFENNNGLPCHQQSLLFNLITIANGNRTMDKALFSRLGDNVDMSAEKDLRQLSFWNDAELFRCREGNGALAVKFREHIELLGGKILLNHRVQSITAKPGKNIHIYVDSEKFKLPYRQRIHKVVLAVAPTAWKNIMLKPAIPKDIRPKMGYLIKYLFNVRPSTTQKVRNLSDAHVPWGMVWEAEKNVDGVDDIDTLALFAGGEHAQTFAKLSNEKARREYIAAKLNTMTKPGAEKFTSDEILSSIFVDYPKQEWVGGGYACPSVGEVTKMGEFLHSAYSENVYFAGEFACRYKWCGFMEGALISGAGVAKDILKSLSNAKREKKPFDKTQKKLEKKKNVLQQLYFKFDPKDLKNLAVTFKAADTDNSGELDLAEFSTLIRKHIPKIKDADIESIFSAFDSDASGSISFRELSISLCIIGNGSNDEKLGHLFDLYDTDGNGTLDAVEFKAVTSKMLQLAKLVGRGDCNDFVKAVQRKLDHNNDGNISKFEWLAVGRKSPSLLNVLGF